MTRPAPGVPNRGSGRPWQRPGWRTFVRLAAALGCLFLGGCIYLRLLELKHQLANFDRYFEVDLREGVRITCRKPVLLDEDMAFFKLVPEWRRHAGVVERWHFRWVKAYPAPGEDPRNYEVAVDFMFVDHKLTRIMLPERLFAFVPKHFFLTILRAFGQAKIDQATRTASASVHEDFGPGTIPPPPSGAELAAMLGAPEAKKETATGVVWNYRYQPASSDQRSGRIDVIFTLNPATQKVRRIQGRVFDLTLDITLPESPTPPPADIKPAVHDAAR